MNAVMTSTCCCCCCCCCFHPRSIKLKWRQIIERKRERESRFIIYAPDIYWIRIFSCWILCNGAWTKNETEKEFPFPKPFLHSIRARESEWVWEREREREKKSLKAFRMKAQNERSHTERKCFKETREHEDMRKRGKRQIGWKVWKRRRQQQQHEQLSFVKKTATSQKLNK